MSEAHGKRGGSGGRSAPGEMRNGLLRVADLEPGELMAILELSIAAKAHPDRLAGRASGRVVAVLFEKPSLRTRFSVESSLARLGAYPIGAYDREVGLGERESMADAAQVLGRYADAIVLRTFAHDRVVELAEHAGVPVVNALSDDHHPMQALADLMTIAEANCDGDVRGLKDQAVAYVGDGNNVAHSLLEACALVGAELRIATPAGHEPDADIVTWAREHGGEVLVTADPVEAVAGADVVYTDVWASMGQEAEVDARRSSFGDFQVTPALMEQASPGAIFLHCLPAHRGEEVAAEVIDGPAARVFDQAENRMHTTTGLFAWLWEID